LYFNMWSRFTARAAATVSPALWRPVVGRTPVRAVSSTASPIPIYTTNADPKTPPPPPSPTQPPPTALIKQVEPSKFPKETKDAINKLYHQPNHYAVVEIMGRLFLVTKNDLVVTDHIRGAKLGDVLDLNRVHELGSKDYTVYGRPLIHKSFFRIRATVVEEPKGKQVETIKFKRRKNYHRCLRNRHHHTILRISEVSVLPQI
jgi:ribosomal protein L21